MWRGWTPFLISLQLVSFAFIYAIVSDYHFVDPDTLAAIRKDNNLDVVAVAAQLGRFDLVSLLLTVFGLMAVFGGLFAFAYVRGQSFAIAKAAAGKVAEDRLTDLLTEFRASLQEMREYGARSEQPSSKPDVGELEKAGTGTENKEFDGKGGK